MEVFTVSFFGHRIIEDPLGMERKLEHLVCRLLQEKEYVAFLVGRDGDFDLLTASVIRRCKRRVRGDNSALVWVLPYETAEIRRNEADFRAYYDEIEICPVVSHFKRAHQARNRAMVDRSDLVVFCIQHESGGAWQIMKYAVKQGVPYINLACGAWEDAG